MARRSDEPTSVITIRILSADLDLLRSAHNRFGYNRVIRRLVHNYCESLLEKLEFDEDIEGNLNDD